MNEITIKYHLLIASIISLVLILATITLRKKIFKKNRILFISVISFLSIYFTIVTLALTSDINNQQELMAFDLNKDGFFSKNEITEEQKKISRKLTNDLGINFSFISGLFVAGFFSTIIFLSGLFLKKIKTLKQNV